MAALIKRYASVFIVLFTGVMLAVYPIADCFDCEGPHPWGRNDVAYLHRSGTFEYWFLTVSLLAGLMRWKCAWIVPVGLVVAEVLTEHFGGVPWWSLRNNEGPVLLAIGLLAGYSALTVGYLLHFVTAAMRKHRAEETL